MYVLQAGKAGADEGGPTFPKLHAFVDRRAPCSGRTRFRGRDGYEQRTPTVEVVGVARALELMRSGTLKESNVPCKGCVRSLELRKELRIAGMDDKGQFGERANH